MTREIMTDTRWHVDAPESTTIPRLHIRDMAGRRICTIAPSEHDADHAALIVRAVNSHAALVAALAELLRIVDSINPPQEDMSAWPTQNAARAALAAAGE